MCPRHPKKWFSAHHLCLRSDLFLEIIMSATQIAQRALLADTDEGRNNTTHRSIKESPTLTSTLQLSRSLDCLPKGTVSWCGGVTANLIIYTIRQNHERLLLLTPIDSPLPLYQCHMNPRHTACILLVCFALNWDP